MQREVIMKNTMIEIKNLSKEYGKFKAVSDASITINQGDIYGLIGKNGAGKTTIFKMMLGLSHASSGSISIMNSSNDAELRKNRQKIGFFIGSNFFSYLNAHDNIEYYRRMKGVEDTKETDRVLKIVGLYGEKKPFKSYSMGMKQRLGIANALLGNPDIVILDEPINGLDPQGIVEIRQLIKKLNKEMNKTLVISSHILSELDLVATRFAIIDRGIILKELDRADLANEEGSVVIIKTNNLEKTVTILKDATQIENISIQDDKIIINQDNINTASLSKYIVESGLELIEIYAQHNSLEDFYFNLTGGQNNA